MIRQRQIESTGVLTIPLSDPSLSSLEKITQLASTLYISSDISSNLKHGNQKLQYAALKVDGSTTTHIADVERLWTVFATQVDTSLPPSTCTFRYEKRNSKYCNEKISKNNPQSLMNPLITALSSEFLMSATRLSDIKIGIHLRHVNVTELESIIILVDNNVYQSIKNEQIDKSFIQSILVGVNNELGDDAEDIERTVPISSTIIRTGDRISSFGKVIHCEPINQGEVTSKTKIIITTGKKTVNFTSSALTAETETTTDIEPFLNGNNLKHDVIDIDSVTSDPAKTAETQMDLIDFDFFSAPLTELGAKAIINKQITIKVSSLSHRVPLNLLTPKPSETEDPENRGFISISKLAKLGCFSGDLVHIVTEKSEKRLIRLFSLPEKDYMVEDAENKLLLSPILIYNIGSPSEVTILPLPHKTDDEARRSLPYFPSASSSSSSYFLPRLAKQVTISRIASPITTLRSLQPAFISSLQSYFNNSHRVVKQGDILAIAIDTVTAENLSSMSSDEAISILNKNQDNLKIDAVAWFKVVQTTVENDSLRNGSVIENGNSHLKRSEQVIIDVSSTRMIQSGLIRESFVSSKLGWESYLGLRPTFNYLRSNQENGQNFVYAKRLVDLLKVTFNTPISPSVLFTSSKRLVGKHTLISSVCQSLGLHLFSLDAYELLSDTDAKTLGTLRARLDRAKQCGEYAVVEIRHIEGLLGTKSQDGKDPAVVSKLVDILDEYINNTTSNPADIPSQEDEANREQTQDNFEEDNKIESESRSTTSKGLILFATTSDADSLSTTIRSKFKFEININVPTEKERKELFHYLISNNCFIRRDVNMDSLALQSAGLTPPDIVSIVNGAKTEAKKRLEIIRANSQNPQLGTSDLILIASNGASDDIQLIPEDFAKSISDARQKYSDSIGAPRIPNVTWNDVGGLDMVKKEILDTIEMPLKYPHLFSGGVKKRSGILFYGPPGTGKTLLAKAIASSFSLNFFSVKGPELLNMYIGESEANVRRVFEKARDAKPCVIFFDELDSVAPKRGNQGDSGGVMDRIVSQLLAELDGMSGKGGDGVFVVGATNRPDLLDEALLRPGRFDKMLYLGISDTHAAQEKILEALTRKFTLSPEVSLARVAEKCSFTYTGADFYALCSDAMLGSMIRTAKEVDQKIEKYNKKRLLEAGEDEVVKPVSTRWWFENIAEKQDITVKVTEEDFERAQKSLIPSVSAEELQHYLRVRETFEGKSTK